MGYTTVSDVKRRIGNLDYDDFGFEDQESFENYLSKLIEQASRLIDGYCGVPQGFFDGGCLLTETFKGSDVRMDGLGCFVKLTYTPVLSASKVEVNKGSDDEPDWRATVDYVAESETGRLYFTQETPSLALRQSVRVEYSAGYPQTPGDVEAVATDTVSVFLLKLLGWLRRERSEPPALTLSEEKLLNPYRRHLTLTG
ncbi:hypothetical protein J7L70_01435 [Candidatus Bathyarchaeota archaeon]|nr:hypothetical protein [Candidatus Bathyarchaeota archaeon]